MPPLPSCERMTYCPITSAPIRGSVFLRICLAATPATVGAALATIVAATPAHAVHCVPLAMEASQLEHRAPATHHPIIPMHNERDDGRTSARARDAARRRHGARGGA